MSTRTSRSTTAEPLSPAGRGRDPRQREGEGARARTLRRPSELVAAGLITSEHEAEIATVAERFAVAITPDMAELIERGDDSDPIARQFVPDAREMETRPEEDHDPIGDRRLSPLKGIVHRYPDRVLLKPSHVCPVYCRGRSPKCWPSSAASAPGSCMATASTSSPPPARRWWPSSRT